MDYNTYYFSKRKHFETVKYQFIIIQYTRKLRTSIRRGEINERSSVCVAEEISVGNLGLKVTRERLTNDI